MPIPVKTRPKFKCQFCLSYRATLKTVERHEGFCWQNPNRHCDLCDNTGTYKTIVDSPYGDGDMVMGTEPCPYCSKEDKELTSRLSR